MAGWGGRDRTFESRDQNPLPYHLATPHLYFISVFDLLIVKFVLLRVKRHFIYSFKTPIYQ